MNTIKEFSKLQHFFFTAFLLLIAAFLCTSIVITPSHPSFDNETVCELVSSWSNDSGSFTTDTLPAKFPCDETGSFTAWTILPDLEDMYANSLCFRSSQNGVRIWIDGQLILDQHNIWEGKRFSGAVPGSSWILVRLPEDYAGKELRIELHSPYRNYQGLLQKIHLGTRASLLFYVAQTKIFKLIIALILLLLSLVLMIIYVILSSRRIDSRQILLVGIFGMLAGIWLFGESQILQFFTGKLIAWFDFTIISMHLLPVPLLFIVADSPEFRYRRFCIGAAHFLCLYLILLMLLQVTNLCDFMNMIPVSFCILLIMCICVLFLIFWDVLYNKNQKIYPLTAAISVFAVFACIELIYDLIDLQAHVGDFIQIGLLIFYIIISVSTVRQAIHLFETGLQSSYYRRLSYTDQMTGCQNRRAFMEREMSWAPGREDALIMIDLNYLKQVNDTLGHQAGDDYISACSEAFLQVLDPKGTCYRLGGDEFLFWGEHLPARQLRELERRLHIVTREKCRSISPLCSIATGIAVYHSHDRDISETMRRADAAMYEAKRWMKQHEETLDDTEVQAADIFL